MEKAVFKSAVLSPTDIRCADSAEFIVTLVVGREYTPTASRIILDLPGTVGMSRPALMHTEDHGYVEAYVSNPQVSYTKRNWDMEIADFATKDKSSWRGMAQRMFVLDLSAGLMEDDVVEIHWGDAANGYGPGAKVTSVVPRPGYEPIIHVRYFDSQEDGVPDLGRSFKGVVRPVPQCEIALPFRIRPREAQRLRLLRKPDKAMLVPADTFWNVAEGVDVSELVEANGNAQRNSFGVFEYADKDVRVVTKGLRLRETARMDNVCDGMNLYWGDVHTHSAFSNDCIEREKLDMDPARLLDSGRYKAGLDYMAVTDHHQPWDKEQNKIGEPYWNRTMEALKERDTEGEFLAFAGIEYRARRGDTEVVFNWFPEYSEIDQPTWTDIRKLWDGLKDRDLLTIPHFHNGGGLENGEWWENIASGREPVLEIYSCHGSYECETPQEQGRGMGKRFRPDQNWQYFLKQGYRYGAVANSDGHKGHVGSSGVTAVFSKSLDKDSILAAYRARRVYATSNARIRMVFTANGALMGAVLPNAADKVFHIDVVGETPLKKIDLYRNGELHERFTPEGISFATDVTVRDDGPANWYVRVAQRDNHIAISSPIWFE